MTEIVELEFMGCKTGQFEVRLTDGSMHGYTILGTYSSKEEAEKVMVKRMNGFVLTAEPATTPKGKPAFRVTCSCSTHPAGKNAAVVETATGVPNWETAHGNVTLAHHPVLGKAAARRGNITPA